MPERFRSRHRAGMKRVSETGETKLSGASMELVGLRKSGEEFPIELSLATWQQNGETFFTSVIRDLTAKKSAEHALSETTKTLQMLIKSSPVGILMMDSNFNLQLWNPACEKMFGWSEAEVLGKPLPYATAENRDASMQILRDMATTRGKYETQLARERKDGTPIHVHLAAMPLLNEQNEVYANMAIVMDVSQQVQINNELVAATKAKSEFLANMSHEIRTPLNGVMGMASLLLETNLSAEQRDYTESMRASAETLLTIINDILDFSKVEAGKIDLENIDFSVDQVVHDIEKTLSFAAQKKGLSLFKSRSPALSEYYKGDPTRIRQVLLNLVANAIKFTPKGHVRIEIKDIGTDGIPKICFEVSDTGIGIPEGAIHRMFQAFSQADSSTTRRFGGTGLGLSICKHLVTLMKGEIGVRSSETAGSTFWFTLPLEPGQAPSKANETNTITETSSTGPRLRVLVAEDVSVNQLIAVKMLERLGHIAVAVANGVEAIDSLRSAPFDVVLMDCQMPEMDGYEATHVIRTSDTLGCKNIPIIAMTANALKGDREKCLAAGMDDYITKPIRSRDLAEILEKNLKTKLAG
jgi:PAS domain S-box-containing protein